VGSHRLGYGASRQVESSPWAPELAEIRPVVEREWANAKRQELSKAFYEKLRAKYAIKVQMPEEAAKP
jgi:hypothetical protein